LNFGILDFRFNNMSLKRSVLISIIMSFFAFTPVVFTPIVVQAQGLVLTECQEGTDNPCRDANILLEQLIAIAEFLFGIIGTLAFVAFVYGGFTMILSFGSAEKFKKGQQILVAAVVGMFIAFGAYMMVNFVLDALGVSPDFRGGTTTAPVSAPLETQSAES
jgi:hypothetical protein